MNVDTQGGAYISGNASAGRDLIGRDQINNITQNAVSLVFLDPLNVAAANLQHDVLQIDAKRVVLTGIKVELLALVSELRATHKSIVALANPLWQLSDNPATFADEFKRAYAGFRAQYDAFDFGDQRTHCSRIREIHSDLTTKRTQLNVPLDWGRVDGSLSALYTADLDIIEEQYRPFTRWLNDAMKIIHQFVVQGDVASAIRAKNALLNAMEPNFDDNKARLEDMNDLVTKLTATS
jgi:hypothetical protein